MRRRKSKSRRPRRRLNEEVGAVERTFNDVVPSGSHVYDHFLAILGDVLDMNGVSRENAERLADRNYFYIDPTSTGDVKLVILTGNGQSFSFPQEYERNVVDNYFYRGEFTLFLQF